MGGGGGATYIRNQEKTMACSMDGLFMIVKHCFIIIQNNPCYLRCFMEGLLAMLVN